MPTRPSRPSPRNTELALLESIRARTQTHARSDLVVGIGDDCAVLRAKPSEEIVVTTDLSIEQVHFRRDWHTPESVGHRCLARGLSDLAAMGARPVAAFVSLALPAELSRGRRSWLTRFYDGLLKLAGEQGVPLAGGDLAQAPERITADIVLVGAVQRGKALLRSGARAGDILYVTGALGGAAAELIAVRRNAQRAGLDFKKQRAVARSGADQPHLYPQPRVAVGRLLVRRGFPSAAIDLSDGLSTDLHHLCDESGLAAELDAAALPIHTMATLAEAAGLADSALALALDGGEDYELLFTAQATTKVPRKLAGVPIHPIGVMKKSRRDRPVVSMKLLGKSVVVKAKGWEHFKAAR